LLLFDGPSYIRTVPTAALLDHLHAAGRLPPFLLVNIGHAYDTRYSRDHELGCNPSFVDALVYDLLPWLRQRYQYSPHPHATIVGGASLGGLATAYAARRYPQVFGNVLSQYGFFSWAPPSADDTTEYEWLAHQFLDSPTLPVRFSLNVGVFDNVGFRNHKQRPSLLIANRHLRDILRAKGYQVAYTEFYGGHDELSKQHTLADALLALCGTAVPTLQYRHASDHHAGGYHGSC
jgi:enterochelin esterase-like enzyme